MDKYEDLLERAIDQLPPEVFEHKRFKIPKAYSDIQGNRTTETHNTYWNF